VIDGFYKLKNEGALLTGEYGRVDYSPYKPNVGKSALKSLKAELPYNSWGVYYHDEIGNISTSHAWRDVKKI
jgi:oligosaccharyltransferase complex subunit alpha (ribophorin I)